MAEKEATERRVYVLPKEMMERIRAYQSDNAISSEVEAVRRLLDAALQMRDTALDLLNKLKARQAEEKDLLVLAKEILASHALIKSIEYEEVSIKFYLKSGEGGEITRAGKIFHKEADEEYFSELAVSEAVQSVRRIGKSRRPASDLDDDIPF